MTVFDLVFPFDESCLLSNEPMTDEEFSEYMKFSDTEVSIEEVDFQSTDDDITY